jgi:hypothetical protein
MNTFISHFQKEVLIEETKDYRIYNLSVIEKFLIRLTLNKPKTTNSAINIIMNNFLLILRTTFLTPLFIYIYKGA